MPQRVKDNEAAPMVATWNRYDPGGVLAGRMPHRAGLLCCFACLAGGASAQSTSSAPEPPALRAQAGLQAILRSGQPTPLDALTLSGRRDFLREMRWRDGKLVGFGSAPLVRELDHAQLAAILHFLDSAEYLPLLDAQLVGPPLRLPAPSMRLAAALAALRETAEEDDARRARMVSAVTATATPAVAQRYAELFRSFRDPAIQRTRTSGDLLALFDAAALTVGRNPASFALDDMLRVHAELATRGVATGRTLDRNVIDALLGARRFDAARAFGATRPHLANVPVPHAVDRLGPGFDGRSAFDYDAARNVLTRVALPSPGGMELVMVVGAGCHNSDNALAALHEDVALQGRLRNLNFKVVTAPNGPVGTALLARWNSDHPALPIRVPYSVREWRAIEGPGVPAFYLLRNGRLVDQRIGWPPEGKVLLGELIDETMR